MTCGLHAANYPLNDSSVCERLSYKWRKSKTKENKARKVVIVTQVTFLLGDSAINRVCLHFSLKAKLGEETELRGDTYDI